MSIPLDRLYHYIESVAQDVYGDTIIYHFYPHGSKNFENLTYIRGYSWVEIFSKPQIICNDQEPLNYKFYQNTLHYNFWPIGTIERRLCELFHEELQDQNLRLISMFNIYDQCLILHSEKNSVDVELYQQNNLFFPVYYWNHAFLALDWFRYAQHLKISKNCINPKTFLIYNRAWSGTREYRLKFLDLLIQNNLVSTCLTSFNPIDPESGNHYQNHQFINDYFIPEHPLEQYANPTLAKSCASADFNIDDYTRTDIEVVLETLFDDSRNYLTEKILRPIACGQPFILMSTKGSLQYLRDYGFKTFSPIINEDYDQIVDPLERMNAVISTMNEIAHWGATQRQEKLKILQEISNFNRTHFFSQDFFNLINNELKDNLRLGLESIEKNNQSLNFINRRKLALKDEILRKMLVSDSPARTKKEIMHLLSLARKY